MSENPNPTRCGRCGTTNPPGRDVCLTCGAPLTNATDPAALAGTPEAADEMRRLEGATEDGPPTVVAIGGIGGAPIPVPAERLDLDPDRPPSE